MVRQAGSPGEYGVGNPPGLGCGGGERGQSGDMGLIGWTGRNLGLWLEVGTVGPILREGSGRKCSFGEILRPLQDLVGMKVPRGDV